MAKYLLSSGYTRPLGSRGGSTFQRNGACFTIRKRAVPVQKRSPRQSAVKNKFDAAAKNFRTLSAPQKTSWYDATSEYPRTNSLGIDYDLSAHALQNSSFYNLRSAGLPAITTIVPDNPIPDPVLDGTVINFNTSDLQIFATSNPVPAGYAFQVFISPQTAQLPVNYFIQNTKLIHTFNEGESMFLNLFDEYMQAYSGQPLPGLPFIYFTIVAIQLSTGQRSDNIWYYAFPVN